MDSRKHQPEQLLRYRHLGTLETFDISDAEGEELPTINYRLNTDNHKVMLDRLRKFANAEGYEVISKDHILGGAKGQKYKTRLIMTNTEYKSFKLFNVTWLFKTVLRTRIMK